MGVVPLPRLRRLLLFLACALALAASGCVEITNPQFDARYRTAVRPVPKLPYAVFAVYHEPDGATPRSRNATLLLVDTDAGSVISSITLDGVVGVSDVGGPNHTVLVTYDDGFGEVNLKTAEAPRLQTAALPHGDPQGSGFDDHGVRVFWQTTARGRQILVSRRVGANEQTATAAAREFKTRLFTGLMLMDANEREAYLLQRTEYEMGKPVSVLWRVDFVTHAVESSTTPKEWPVGFVLDTPVHGDRAIRRWGRPVATASGGIAFVDLAGAFRTLPVTATVGAYGPEIVFQPGGEDYLEIRRVAVPMGQGSVSWGVAERSLVSTGTRIVYQQELPTPGRIPIDPLGVIADEMFAFGVIRPAGLGTGEASASAGQMRATYDLHLRGIENARDVVVASIPSPSEAPHADFLGTVPAPTR